MFYKNEIVYIELIYIIAHINAISCDHTGQLESRKVTLYLFNLKTLLFAFCYIFITVYNFDFIITFTILLYLNIIYIVFTHISIIFY